MAPFVAVFGVVFGAIAGLVVSPAIVALLKSKPLGAASAILLVAAIGAGALGGATLSPIALCLSPMVFVGAAALAACLLPHVPARVVPGHCAHCGYDLRQLAICPECGRPSGPVDPPTPRPKWVRASLAIVLLGGGLGLLGLATYERHRVHSTPELIEQLGNNDMQLQWEARHELARRDPSALVQALNHPKVAVRRNAAWALEDLPIPAARPALERLVNDPDPWTRDHARKALERLPPS